MRTTTPRPATGRRQWQGRRRGVAGPLGLLCIALICLGCGTSAGGSAPSGGTAPAASTTAASLVLSRSGTADSAAPSGASSADVPSSAGPSGAAAGAAQSPTGSSAALLLPAPTGSLPTGTALLHLKDTGRVDPLDPAGGQREVMVQLWYPAQPSDLPLAEYAPAAEAAALQQFYPVPQGGFSAVTNSRVGAPVAGGEHAVVFFHHGLCASRTDSTIVAEQLASLGYLVVAMGNTHESAAVAFPDGRVITPSDPAYCNAGADPVANKDVLEKLLQVRVDDVSFTADALQQIADGQNPDVEGEPLPAGLASSMDLSRFGIYGHSFGGGTAAAVLLADDRFVAGVDLDGFVAGPVAVEGLDKPFLVVGSSYHDQLLDTSWATFLPALRGWHRWIQVKDAGHYRFVDLGGSVKHFGLDSTLKSQDPTTWDQVFGNIDDAASQQIDRDLVAGFFDQFLRDRPAPILDDPAAVHPELVDRTAEIAGFATAVSAAPGSPGGAPPTS